ncbi:MAG: hypothetical protein R6X35_12250 [Candidatus Krumholzibacteriia bacterium]
MHEKLPDPVPAPAIAEETEGTCTCTCKGTTTDANPEGTAVVANDLLVAVHYDIGNPAEE